MKFFKLTAAAALVAASLSASAMTSINDEQLSTVSGQDGVSIVANLNVNIGSFTYTDTDSTGGSVNFNKISITGMLDMTIDVLNAAAFQAAVGGDAAGYLAAAGDANAATDAATVLAAVGAATGYAGQDVVQFAFPKTSATALVGEVSPTITVGSITTGNTTADANGHVASFGSFAIKNLDLSGTTVWMYAH